MSGTGTPEPPISVENAINTLGNGKFQWRIIICAGLCFAADSMEVTLLSFLSSYLKAEWNLTTEQSATITSSVFAGAMIGTLTLGPLADVYGRRPLFLTAAAMVSFFGTATALAQNFPTLVALRFFVGFGVGGLVVPFDALAEFLPTPTRGRILLFVEYFWTLGSMSVPILAYLTIGLGRSWNLFVLLTALPCFCSLVAAYFYVPESPRWLVAKERTEEALDVLRSAALVNGKDPMNAFKAGTVIEGEHHEHSSYLELLTPKWMRLNLLLWGIWFGLSFAYYGTILTITRIFEKDVGEGEEASFNFKAIFISCTAEILGTSIVIYTVERFGRISTQIVFYLLGGIFIFILCFISYSASSGLLTFFAFCARTCEMAATCTTWVTTPEVLSTEIRTTGHSAANAVARIGGIICPFLVESDIPLLAVGLVLLISHVITAMLVFLLPETKGTSLGSVQPTRCGVHIKKDEDETGYELPTTGSLT